MTQLRLPSQEAQAILRELVKHMAAIRVVPGDPRTFVGYKQVHDALALQKHAATYGDSLKVQGLEDLAEWTHREGHPAVTGLIVDQSTWLPGKGYFEIFNRPDDYGWWVAEVSRSLTYDWQRFVGMPPATSAIVETQKAIEPNEPPTERVLTTTYQVLRDTEIARKVKAWHRYECQLCGFTISLPDGSRYAEAHHLQPLGHPHDGPDIIGNVICVCPNHHAQLDLGAIEITLALLRNVESHIVSPKFVSYHNQKIHQPRKI